MTSSRSSICEQSATPCAVKPFENWAQPSVLARPPGARRSLLHHPVKALTLVLVLVMLALPAAYFGPHFIDSLAKRTDYRALVHTDHSRVSMNIGPRQKKRVTIVYMRDLTGARVPVAVDEAKFAAFFKENYQQLLAAQTARTAAIEATAQASLTPIFSDMESRIDRFANWYFGWTTSYKLLSLALDAAVDYALHPISAMGLKETMAQAVEHHIQMRYQNTVLRPEFNQPRIEVTVVNLAQDLHNDFRQDIEAFSLRFQAFLEEEAYLFEQPDNATVTAEMDWAAQLHKLSPLDLDGHSFSVVRGALLSVLGARAGSSLGSAVGAKLTTRLAVPFVSRALAGAGGSATGSVAGTAVGGPVGAVIGSAVGFGVGLAGDYLISTGIELTQRDAFEADVHEALTATQAEWAHAVTVSLTQTVNAWYDDTLQLMAAYRATD